MLIEEKGNRYEVTNKLTIAQMLKNGGIEILDHIIDYAKESIMDYIEDSITEELPKEKKVSRRIKK